MYPGYRRRDVFDEYMSVFLALLNEGYRQENAHYLMLATISRLPWFEQEPATNFLRQLEWASKRPDDILETNEDASSSEDIKKFFGKF